MEMFCYLSSPNPKLQRRSGSPPVGGDVPRLLHLQRPPLHPPRPPRHLDLLHPQDGLLLCVCQRGTATHPPPYGINKMFPDIYFVMCSRLLVKPFSNLIPCFFSKFLYFMVKVWPRGIWLWQWITNSYCNVKPSRWRLSPGATIILGLARLRINSISKHLKGRWRHESDTFLGLVAQSIAVGYAKVLPVLPSANRITLCK